jgi:hypothetical protein
MSRDTAQNLQSVDLGDSLGGASNCYTEMRKTMRDEGKVVIMAMLDKL